MAPEAPKPTTKKIKKPELPTKATQEPTKTTLHALKLAKLATIRTNLTKHLKLDNKLVQKAITVLKSISAQKKNNILDIGDDFVYIEIVLSRVPQKHSIRPI